MVIVTTIGGSERGSVLSGFILRTVEGEVAVRGGRLAGLRVVVVESYKQEERNIM